MRQFLENLVELEWQRKEERLLILRLVPSIRSWNLPFSNSIWDHVMASATPTLQPVKYRKVIKGRRWSGIVSRNSMNCAGMINPFRMLFSFSIGK